MGKITETQELMTDLDCLLSELQTFTSSLGHIGQLESELLTAKSSSTERARVDVLYTFSSIFELKLKDAYKIWEKLYDTVCLRKGEVK